MNTEPNWWREPPEMPPNPWELLAKFKAAIEHVKDLEDELEATNKQNKKMAKEIDRYKRLLSLAEQVIEQNQYLPRD